MSPASIPPLPQLPWLSPAAGNTPILVLAHRGIPGPWRENTLAAFRAALEAGADGFELDVRRSADGVPVVHHDAKLDDGTPVGELEAAALPGWMPTLEQALAACAGAVVDVEIKNSPGEPCHDPAEQLAGQVAQLVAESLAAGRGPGAALVSCFWPATLQAVRRERPEVATGLLLFPALDTASALEQAGECGARVLLPFRSRLEADLLDGAHRRGMAVVAWGADDEEDLRAAARAGVDGVVTDCVGRALEVLGRA